MPLIYLLYRCPECGHDPTEGRGDRARCPSCGAAFERVGGSGRIRVEAPDREGREVEAPELVDAIEAHGGPLDALEEREGRGEYASAAVLRRAHAEEPVHHEGSLLGFAERYGPKEAGTLRLRGETLSFAVDGATVGQWSLLDLRSIQTSSSSLQITGEDGMVEFRFVDDSPRRWESLLHHLLREAYRREGRGEIVEFQPRIVAEPEERWRRRSAGSGPEGNR